MKVEQRSIWVVLPAAGVGSRMEADCPKQYLSIGNKTLIQFALETLLELPNIKGIVVAINTNDKIWPTLKIAAHPNITTVVGGQERSDSVLNAVNYIDSKIKENTADRDNVWVCVHDAARPCVELDRINKLIADCFTFNTGAILAAPVTDTIKRAQPDFIINRTENRDNLWQAHTPQMFKLPELKQALDYCLQHRLAITDEASAVEQCGGLVRIVPDRRDNIKVTVPEDLTWVETILAKRINLNQDL